MTTKKTNNYSVKNKMDEFQRKTDLMKLRSFTLQVYLGIFCVNW